MDVEYRPNVDKNYGPASAARMKALRKKLAQIPAPRENPRLSYLPFHLPCDIYDEAIDEAWDILNTVEDDNGNLAIEVMSNDAAHRFVHIEACRVLLEYAKGDPVKLAECLPARSISIAWPPLRSPTSPANIPETATLPPV